MSHSLKKRKILNPKSQKQIAARRFAITKHKLSRVSGNTLDLKKRISEAHLNSNHSEFGIRNWRTAPAVSYLSLWQRHVCALSLRRASVGFRAYGNTFGHCRVLRRTHPPHRFSGFPGGEQRASIRKQRRGPQDCGGGRCVVARF